MLVSLEREKKDSANAKKSMALGIEKNYKEGGKMSKQMNKQVKQEKMPKMQKVFAVFLFMEVLTAVLVPLAAFL